MSTKDKSLTAARQEELLQVLRQRFEQNAPRHPGVQWQAVQARLEARGEKLWALGEMESSGGEPDVLEYDEKTDSYIFCDCSAESPIGRRNLCYDQQALEARKKNKPQGSAAAMAAAMGARLMTEEEYARLQSRGEFDVKTSSWLATPEQVRALGGALFGDRRFGRVFIYHNGADSYYAVRGFRAVLQV